MNTNAEPRDIDHLDPAFWSDLHRSTADLREYCPVAHSSAHGGYTLLTRYRDVHDAFTDPKTFCSSQGVTVPHFGGLVLSLPVESDPPLHGQYRNVAWDWFTPGAVREFEPEIKAIVDDVLSGLDGRGECDLIADVAAVIPPRVIARRCGIADELVEPFCELIHQMFLAAASNDPEAAALPWQRFFEYLGELMEHSRREPGDDVITAITQATIDGRAITQDEALGLLFTIVIGGHETTINSIGFLLAHIASSDLDRTRLIAEPELRPSAIDESLRLDSPFQFFARTVTEDTEVGGVILEAGSKVVLSFGGANRDPREFPEPEEFELGRKPNRHIAFGHGIHKCLGQHLAKAELRIVLDAVLERFPDLRVSEEGLPNPVLQALTWGLPSLPVSLGPGQPNGA